MSQLLGFICCPMSWLCYWNVSCDVSYRKFVCVCVLLAARQLTVQMMQNPQILAALQERLDGLVGSPSGYMER